MESTERTFRHSFGKLALMLLGLLALGYAVFSIGSVDYFLVSIVGIGFVVALFYSTSSIRISNEEIVTRRLLGSKSLRWSEIGRVSMRGQALRLHNHEEDVTLSFDSQLESYAEILDIIFNKRPDLFDVGENDVMSTGLFGSLFTIGFGLLLIGLSIFVFSASEELGALYALIFFALGLYVIVSWFLSPKSIILEDQKLLVMYFFKEVSCMANDIKSVTLERRKTRNGYIYFVHVNLNIGKPLKLPGFKQGSVLSYQILKRWHENAISRQSIFR